MDPRSSQNQAGAKTLSFSGTISTQCSYFCTGSRAGAEKQNLVCTCKNENKTEKNYRTQLN